MRLIASMYHAAVTRSTGLGLAVSVLLVFAVVTVSAIPTSVLANTRETSVNPLLYNDLDYLSNSIPHGGTWDGPAEGIRNGHPRNYDVLANLLNAPQQTFYDEPVPPSVSYPYMWLRDRSKRSVNRFENGHVPSVRPKRSPAKLTPADALSLLALLDSRDPYPSMSDYFPLVPANGPNDVLPYSPNSVYQDVPLSLALAQLGAHSFGNAPYGDDDGEWLNTWTEPAVDYLGFPLDVDTLSRLDGYGSKPTKNGLSQQKRYMITKRKRSINQNDGCKNDKKSCLPQKHSQLTTGKVSAA